VLRIGRADDARILLEEDAESRVRPTFSEPRRVTMAARSRRKES
jgi:hypothetical protein